MRSLYGLRGQILSFSTTLDWQGYCRNIYIYIYIYIYIWKYVFYISSLSFFGFCVLLALGGFNIGQKGGGNYFLPARQTHFGEFCWAPFGGNTFSENAPNKKRSYLCLNTSVNFIMLFHFLIPAPRLKCVQEFPTNGNYFNEYWFIYSNTL